MDANDSGGRGDGPGDRGEVLADGTVDDGVGDGGHAGDAPGARDSSPTGPDGATVEEIGGRPDVGVDAGEEDTTSPTDRRTRRWYGVGTLSLFALGVGVLTGTAAPLLAGVFGFAFAGYSAVTRAPTLDLAVERSIDADDVEPGEDVPVTVTVTNEGRWPIFDLRLVDGVPERLGVTAGTPRHGAVLRSGESTTFTYAVRALRGRYTFEPATVVARDLGGGNERIALVGDRSTLACPPAFPSDPAAIPLRSTVSQFTGRFPGDTGGPGLEFHATRRYRRGDPLNRVDWRRTARTGELTTVEFRVERAVRVCLVFDVRDAAYVAPAEGEPSAVERAVEGGIEAYASLTREGHDVGIGVIGPRDAWLSPGSGDRHRRAARQLFGSDPALSPTPAGEDTNIYRASQRLKGRLSGTTQILLFTPLCDDRILATAVRLDAHGYAVTVVSPDPTADGTTGQVYARIERRLRIADLRSRAIPVVDWAAEDDLGQAIAHATRRWST